jgi:hypothetical protein
MHEGVSKCGVVVGDKAQGFGQIVLAHCGLEVGERLEVLDLGFKRFVRCSRLAI